MGLSRQTIQGGSAIALIALVGGLVATNPPEEAYLNYASEKFVSEIKESACQQNVLHRIPGGVHDFLRDIGLDNSQNRLQQLCQDSLTAGGDRLKPFLKDFIQQSTTQQNFQIFSLYHTEILDQKVTTLAILGHFISFT
ncbi:DUF4359 domain-containing protein [Spirulina subsalsa]|uniref:DUF4359 domain-containing protein n=1 Tax=Spirulina subsalsa TaxID=54311 RepID=UPI0002F5690A|nr:DUF4359 domain-containing protein [Spirulina subsalsa]